MQDVFVLTLMYFLLLILSMNTTFKDLYLILNENWNSFEVGRNELIHP